MAQVKSLGKVTVTTATTIVPITTTEGAVNSISIQALHANTGKIYVGDSSLVVSSLVGCFRVLNAGESYTHSTFGLNDTDPKKLYIDAGVSGEGALVAVIIR